MLRWCQNWQDLSVVFLAVACFDSWCCCYCFSEYLWLTIKTPSFLFFTLNLIVEKAVLIACLWAFFSWMHNTYCWMNLSVINKRTCSQSEHSFLQFYNSMNRDAGVIAVIFETKRAYFFGLLIIDEDRNYLWQIEYMNELHACRMNCGHVFYFYFINKCRQLLGDGIHCKEWEIIDVVMCRKKKGKIMTPHTNLQIYLYYLSLFSQS